MNKLTISPGNMKVKFPIFNLPAQGTCPGSTPMCEEACYAMKAQRQYPDARESRERNLKLSKTKEFIKEVNAWFKSKRKPVKYFRIHESGDFYDQEYLDKWIEIAKAQPKTKFLAYTKSFHLDFLKVPTNMIIYYSIMPDSKRKIFFGHKAYACFEGHEEELPDNIFICGTKGKLCHKCMHCFMNKQDGDVYFKAH